MMISFIIPVYNSANTIVRCLDSLYFLPLRDEYFEVIVVDDCSLDNSVEIITEYAKRHNSLTLLCQPENHRQGAARNIGLSVAKGEYVVFLDSDDELAPGILQALKMAVDGNLDMVAMRVASVSIMGSVENEKALPYLSKTLFTGVELQTEHPFWFTGPVAYVYWRPFLESVNYPFEEDVLYEDSDFVNVHLYYAKRVSYCDECGYKAYFNPKSTTHTMSYKHLCDYALLGTRMLTFYHSIDDKTTKYAESILEGGSFNIMIAFKKLFYLKSVSEVRAFYDRFDSKGNRKSLVKYRRPSYCWNRWTRFCIRHRKLATMLLGVMIPFVKLRNK